MKWSELTPRQQERLAGLVATLEEFAYGFDQSGLMNRVSEEGSAAQRFYSHSLYQYFSNIFLVSGTQETRLFLEEIGSEDLIDSIDSILAYEVGNRTLGYAVKAFRDKQLVHTSFTPERLERHLRSDITLSDPHIEESLPIWIFDLFARTRDLYANLLGRFPELHSQSDLSR